MTQNERKEILKEYKRQKEIESYQQSRVLSTPNTTYARVIIWSILYIVIIISVCIITKYVVISFTMRITIDLIFSILFSEFYFRFLGVKIVECYQHYAKEDTRRRCLCVPSCSEYAILCLKKYELIKALLKIRKRLFVTCKGEDYKIDFP